MHAAARGATAEPSIVDAFDSVHELPLSRSLRDPAALVRGYRALRALSAEIEPDLIHVHSPIAGFVTRAALGRKPHGMRPPVVYTAHGFHAHPGGRLAANLLYSLWEAVAGRWTDALIVINDEDEARARQWRMVSRKRLVRMAGIGVDVTHYDPTGVAPSEGAAFRSLTGIPPKVPLFVMIAELHRAKRPLDAIHALAAMTRRDAHLVLLGEGPLEPAIRALVERYRLADRVHLCGFVQDVRLALASATACLLTSEREGLPRALMEALSMGIPVVTTSARGCAELVGDAGTVVAVGDVSALAAAMDRMDRSSATWVAMSRAGRARMTERYTLDRLLVRHERLYRRLLAGTLPRSHDAVAAVTSLRGEGGGPAAS